MHQQFLSTRLQLRSLGCLGSAIALLSLTGQPLGAQSHQPPIIIQGPIIYPPMPTKPARQQRVRVQFVAEGDAWGSVYLDDRLLFSPRNFNRREEFWLEKRAYRLEITGITRFDVWDSGYLDVGRADSGALIVVFSEAGGVRVIGDANAWLPDVPE